MWFVDLLCSRAGRVLRVVGGTWLLMQGMSRPTLEGLMMTMAGIVIAVTGLAGVCFAEEARPGWTARHATTKTDHS
jgi:hypothetical protein